MSAWSPISDWPSAPLTADQRDLVSLVDQLTAEIGGDVAEAERDRTPDVVPARIRKVLADTGLLGVGLAAQHGGAGADVATVLLAVQRLAVADPVAAMVVVHQHAAASGAGETDLVAGIVAGRLAVYVDADAARGLDIRPAAERHGSPARLDTGIEPDWIVVRHGHACVAVAWPDQRVVAGSPVRRSGLRGLGTSIANVDVAALFGEGGVGDEALAARARTLWRLGVAAAAIGVAERATAIAARYVRERQQFGAPLIDLPAMQVRLARVVTELGGAWSQLWAAAPRAPAPDPSSSAAVALLTSSVIAAARRAADEALGMLGGYGYVSEFGLTRAVRDLISLSASSTVGLPNLAHSGWIAAGGER